jgi:hypothetical protein
MSYSLPESPDLDQLRRQAKELREAPRLHEPGAVERIVRQGGSASHRVVKLATAQFVIAGWASPAGRLPVRKSPTFFSSMGSLLMMSPRCT